MMPVPMQLARLWVAEVVKLLSRPLARIGWVVLAGLGLAVVLGVDVVGGAELEMNGQPTSLAASPAGGVLISLVVRNFYIAQILILVLGATTLAGEYQQRTLREDLLRPVPRWAVLLAKWAAIVTWSAVALALQWVVTVVAAFVFLAAEGETAWTDVFSGFVVALASDASFAAVVLMIAAMTRSVTGTIAATFLFLVMDGVLWGVLSLGDALRGGTGMPGWMITLLDATPYLPSNLWSLGSQVGMASEPHWTVGAALVGLTVLALAVAERVFSRVDVP